MAAQRALVLARLLATAAALPALAPEAVTVLLQQPVFSSTIDPQVNRWLDTELSRVIRDMETHAKDTDDAFASSSEGGRAPYALPPLQPPNDAEGSPRAQPRRVAASAQHQQHRSRLPDISREGGLLVHHIYDTEPP